MIRSFWINARWALVPIFSGAIFFHTLLPKMQWDFTLLHVLVEGGGAIMGFGLAFFVYGMIRNKRLPMNYIWLVSCFVSMGILDMAHSLVLPGQAFVWLHSTATFVGGFFVSLIWLPATVSKKCFQQMFVYGLIGASITFSLCSIIWPEFTYPMLDGSREFTFAAEFLNFTGGIGFLFAWYYFFLQHYRTQKPDSAYFSNHFALFGLAGMLFEFSALWDGNWWLWHILRALAYMLLAYYFITLYWRDLAAITRLNKELEIKIQNRTSDLKDMLLKLQDTQSELVQAGRLAAIGTLSAGIAHDLRQPLSIIRMSVENAREQIAEKNYSLDKVSSVFSKVINNADRMNKTIDHLRSFASKHHERDMEKIDLALVLKSSFDLVGVQLNDHGIAVSKNIAEEIFVNAHAYQLEQVIINLLSNAQDALEGVDKPEIEVLLKKTNGNAVLSISDNGPGVPLKIQEEIFNPFFSTKGVGMGVGLGLSVSHGLINKHDGEIAVSDVFGGGARFTVSIPLAEGKGKPKHKDLIS